MLERVTGTRIAASKPEAGKKRLRLLLPGAGRVDYNRIPVCINPSNQSRREVKFDPHRKRGHAGRSWKRLHFRFRNRRRSNNSSGHRSHSGSMPAVAPDPFPRKSVSVTSNSGRKACTRAVSRLRWLSDRACCTLCNSSSLSLEWF